MMHLRSLAQSCKQKVGILLLVSRDHGVQRPPLVEREELLIESRGRSWFAVGVIRDGKRIRFADLPPMLLDPRDGDRSIAHARQVMRERIGGAA